MEPELRDLLREVADEPVGDSHTHVSLFGPHSRWLVRPHSMAAFWKGYCNIVTRYREGYENEEGEDVAPSPLAPICLAERPMAVMPLITHFTFKFQVGTDDEENWEPYGDDFLHHLVNTHQRVICEYFRIGETQMELAVVVMESSTHWYEVDQREQRFLVMELRLHFPYARMDVGVQNRIIRPRIIYNLRSNNLMARMHRQPIGDWDSIISTTVVNEPVVMYGSTPVTERPKLEHIHVWSVISNEMVEQGLIPAEIALHDAFVPQSHTHVRDQIIPEDTFAAIDDLTHWLPVFLSLTYWPLVMTALTEDGDTGRFQQLRTMNTVATPRDEGFWVGRNQDDYAETTDMELAEQMVGLLAPHRFHRETFWLDIGKALHHADDGGDNGLLAWIRHSEQAAAGGPHA